MTPFAPPNFMRHPSPPFSLGALTSVESGQLASATDPGAAFSADGRSLVHVGENGVIKIWDVATEKEILALDEHQGPLKGLALSPDGRQIAAAGQDGTLQICDAAPLRHDERITFMTLKLYIC